MKNEFQQMPRDVMLKATNDVGLFCNISAV
jgi:hypothetical protein